MAKKERQKRAARQARAQERAERDSELQAHPTKTDGASGKTAASSALSNSKKSSQASKPKKKGRIRTYFSDVKAEIHRVVWPSKTELRNYSVAVIAMLIVFGVCVWLVDTGFVALLVGFTGLRG